MVKEVFHFRNKMLVSFYVIVAIDVLNQWLVFCSFVPRFTFTLWCSSKKLTDSLEPASAICLWKVRLESIGYGYVDSWTEVAVGVETHSAIVLNHQLLQEELSINLRLAALRCVDLLQMLFTYRFNMPGDIKVLALFWICWVVAPHVERDPAILLEVIEYLKIELAFSLRQRERKIHLLCNKESCTAHHLRLIHLIDERWPERDHLGL